MSIWGRRLSIRSVAVISAIFLMTIGLAGALMDQSAREIRLVARNMTFYLEADPTTPNPVINARPGETLRIVLVNRERGMAHDFAVPSLDASTEVLEWNEEDAVTFDVPREPGTYVYVCRPHLLMMKGTLKVSR
jgi:plastocyanin